MYLYVEMWNAKHAWLALDADSRKKFIDKVNAFLGSLEAKGLSLMGCALNDGDIAPRVNYRYLAIWHLEDKSMVSEIADGTAKLGWYTYFDQVNIGGDQIGPDKLIGEMMRL